MNNAECPEHPGCRESILEKLEERWHELSCRINSKLGVKTFWTGLSAALAIIGIVAMLTYSAYAGRMKRVEEGQKAQDIRVEKQGEAIQRIDKTVEKIKVKQNLVIKNQDDVKAMLRTLLNKEVNGGSRYDKLGTN